MKKLLLIVALAFTTMMASAQEENCAYHQLEIGDLLKYCKTETVPYVGDYNDKKLSLVTLLLSFSEAYPNELFNQLVRTQLMGKNEESDCVFDTANGYCSAELLTELSPSVALCYWSKTDGTYLVGLALNGYTYGEVPGRDSEENSTSISSLFFYTYTLGEPFFMPVSTDKILGTKLGSLENYTIRLPRQGKDIVLEKDGKKTVFRWNNGTFRR